MSSLHRLREDLGPELIGGGQGGRDRGDQMVEVSGVEGGAAAVEKDLGSRRI